jgi:hypothetical protein
MTVNAFHDTSCLKYINPAKHILLLHLHGGTKREGDLSKITESEFEPRHWGTKNSCYDPVF